MKLINKRKLISTGMAISAVSLAALFYSCAGVKLTPATVRQMNTVEAYYTFVSSNMDSPQVAEALEEAAKLIAKGLGLRHWPKFLRLVGTLENTEYATFVASYINHPITEIRREALRALVAFASRDEKIAVKYMSEQNAMIIFAAQDPDPLVRLGARKLVSQAGKSDELAQIPDYSPLVKKACYDLTSRLVQIYCQAHPI